MTSVIERPNAGPRHPGEYEGLSATQDRLITHTRWEDLFYDFTQPPLPDQDDYNRTLEHVPEFVYAAIADQPAEDMAATRDYLVRTSAAFDHYGYGRIGALIPTERPSRHRHTDLADYIQDWLDHTTHITHFMSGSRLAQATNTLPTEQLKTLVALSSHESRSRLPTQIEDGLWAAAQRVMDEYDQSLEPERHSRYTPLRLHGSEHLRAYNMEPQTFVHMLRESQLAYPPELMLGIRHVRLEDYVPQHQARLLGEVIYAQRAMNLYLPTHATDPHGNPRDFAGILKETIDHEFAHVVHANAPNDWLKRWEGLMRNRRISVSAYAEHSHRHNPDEGRAEDFAEITRIYRNDPMRLLYLSRDHFELVNELLRMYDESSVRAATAIATQPIPIEDPRFIGAEQQLIRSRQRVIEQRLQHFESGDVSFGGISIAALDSHRRRHAPRRRAA